MDFDFHTHRLDTPPGTGIVSLPQDIVRNPKVWTTYPSAQQFHPQGLYAAGIHPWWTLDEDFDLEEYKAGLSQLWDLPQVVQIGECGFDRLRGASLEVQQLLKAGFHLSFGKHYNENSFLLTPPQHRHLETDALP